LSEFEPNVIILARRAVLIGPLTAPGFCRQARALTEPGLQMRDRRSRHVFASHGIVFQGSRFWVTHRRRRYGPFDYEWSKDFAGIELTFAGDKFGEYCGKEEIFADLKEYRLPASVVPVATIVIGCVVFAVLNGLREEERERLIVEHLAKRGFERFALIETEPEPSAFKRNPRRID
jgi:hypothetical protein